MGPKWLLRFGVLSVILCPIFDYNFDVIILPEKREKVDLVFLKLRSVIVPKLPPDKI